MKITISGTPGSGKSTIGKLAEKSRKRYEADIGREYFERTTKCHHNPS